MPDYDYDLITLGAGSGGVAASRRASALGAKVAIIEGSRVGGTCVIRGCVPKKLMMYAAQLGDALHEARGYGWAVEAAAFDMAPWAAQKAAETRRLEGVYRQLLNGAGVQVIDGWARIDGPNTVMVGEQRLSARHLLIATGARPVRDSIEGIGDCPTSDDVLDLQAVPAASTRTCAPAWPRRWKPPAWCCTRARARSAWPGRRTVLSCTCPAA